MHWCVWSVMLIFLAIILHTTGTSPLNTDLYSVSFLLVTGGTSCLVLAGFYHLLDTRCSVKSSKGRRILNIENTRVSRSLGDINIPSTPTSPAEKEDLVIIASARRVPISECGAGWAVKCAFPFQCVGKNSLLIYLLACSGIVQNILAWFYWNTDPMQNLGAWLWPGSHWGTCAAAHKEGVLCNDPWVLLWTVCYVGFYTLVGWGLHRKRIYVKI